MISKLTEFRQRLHPGAFLWIAPFLLVLIQKVIVAESTFQNPKKVFLEILLAVFFGILNFFNWIYSKSNKKALFFSIAISFAYFLTETHDLAFYNLLPFVTLIWVLLLNLYLPRRRIKLAAICTLIIIIVLLMMQPEERSQDLWFVSIILGVSVISLFVVNRVIKSAFIFRRISIFLGLNGIMYICAGALTSLRQSLTIGLALIFTAISAK